MTASESNLYAVLENLADMADQLCLAAHIPGHEAEVMARLGAGLAALTGAGFEALAVGHPEPIRLLSQLITRWVEMRPDPSHPGLTIGQTANFDHN